MKESRPVPVTDPASLPIGAEIGEWRVESWCGRGTYGTVYCVERKGREREGLYALKLALHARDDRFERERELLSRLHHPNVQRLEGHGVWRHPLGRFPYVVMQWVAGVPLYEWAAQRNPTSRQVLRLLAQVARALEATSKAGGVHRDVKGDNVLVRLSDERVFLTDFGAGRYRGAVTVTSRTMPPGTLNYRSPEAWGFQRLFTCHPLEHYRGNACDDLFALGVAAYRLVTGEYPPTTEPGREGAEVWQPGAAGPNSPRALNPRVCPELESLILRMLAVNPAKRFKGQARQAADALEYAAENAAPAADVVLFDVAASADDALRAEKGRVVREVEPRGLPPRQLSSAQEGAGAIYKQSPTQPVPLSWVAWAAGATLGLSLVSVAVLLPMRQEMVRLTKERESRGGDSVGVGDSAEVMSVSASAPEPNAQAKQSVGLPMPEGPLPDQRKPPCGKNGGTEIRGGCWHRLADGKPPCSDDAYVWKGECYVPARAAQRRPTSESP